MREPGGKQRLGGVTATVAALVALLLLAGCKGKNPGQPPECGNGMVDEAELCDGFNLDGVTCEGLGLGGGAIGCQPDCRSYDLSGCEIQADCGNHAIVALGSNSPGSEAEQSSSSVMNSTPRVASSRPKPWSSGFRL